MSRTSANEAAKTQIINDRDRSFSRSSNTVPKSSVGRSPQTLSSITRFPVYNGTRYNMAMGVTVGLHATDDPLTRAMKPPEDETSEERTKRLKDEEEALKRSKSIDEQLIADGRERQQLDSRTVKVLLLGQAESGKSTTLKNFQLTFAPSQFHAEREAWKAVIQLNLISSIRIILDALNAQLAEDFDMNPTPASHRRGLADNSNINKFPATPSSPRNTSNDSSPYSNPNVPRLSLTSGQQPSISVSSMESSGPSSYIPAYNHNNTSTSSVTTITSSQTSPSTTSRSESAGTIGAVARDKGINSGPGRKSKTEKVTKEGKGTNGEGAGKTASAIISSLGGLGFGRDKDKFKEKYRENEKGRLIDKELREANGRLKNQIQADGIPQQTPLLLNPSTASSLARARTAISANTKPSIYNSQKFSGRPNASNTSNTAYASQPLSYSSQNERPRTQSSDSSNHASQMPSISMLSAEHRKLLLRLRALIHVEKQLAEALDMESIIEGDPYNYSNTQSSFVYRRDQSRTPTSPTSSVFSSYSSHSSPQSRSPVIQSPNTVYTPISPRTGYSIPIREVPELPDADERYSSSETRAFSEDNGRQGYGSNVESVSEDDMEGSSSKSSSSCQRHEFFSRAGDAWKRAIKQGRGRNDRDTDKGRDQERYSEEEGKRERKSSGVYVRQMLHRERSAGGNASQSEKEYGKDSEQEELSGSKYVSRKGTTKIDTKIKGRKSKIVSSPTKSVSPVSNEVNNDKSPPLGSTLINPNPTSQTFAERIYDGPLPIIMPVPPTKLHGVENVDAASHPISSLRHVFSSSVNSVSGQNAQDKIDEPAKQSTNLELRKTQSSLPDETSTINGLRVRESVLLEKKKREYEKEKAKGTDEDQSISRGRQISFNERRDSANANQSVRDKGSKSSDQLQIANESVPSTYDPSAASSTHKSTIEQQESHQRTRKKIRNGASRSPSNTRIFSSLSSPAYTAASAAATVLAASAEDVVALWNDPVVRSVLREREVEVEWGCGFFLDDASRVASANYMPSDNDILKARIQTQGVEEHRIVMETAVAGSFRGDPRKDWLIYDVSGSRGTRHKWIPYFENVDAIIFLAPLLYTQTLAEDPTIPRVVDSLQLFSEVVSHPLLSRASIVLFLNKLDLTARAIKQGKRVSDYLRGYPKDESENNISSLVKAFRTKYKSIYKTLSPPHRMFFCHETSVIDSKATSKILHSVREGIVYNNLHDANVL